MKATLIMKNGMSIDLDKPKEVLLYGHKIEDLNVLVEALSLGYLKTDDFEQDLKDVHLVHVVEAEDKAEHTFTYTFPLEAYNWGYTHEQD